MRESFHGFWPIWKFAEKQESRFGFVIAIGAILVPLLTIFYVATNRLASAMDSSGWDPKLGLDDQIPFIAPSIFIYLSLFWLFIPLPLYCMPNTERARKELMIFGQAMIVVNFISYVVFVVSPAEVYLRDVAIQEMSNRSGLLNEMYELLWIMDEPYNAWPSLHVSIATLMTMFAIRCWKGKPVLQWGIGLMCVLMCLSITTTKQHFAWDLITGWALVAAIWFVQIRPGLQRIDVELQESTTSNQSLH